MFWCCSISYIDTSEIGSVLRALGNNPTDDEIHEIIETWDRNRDGKINFDEFTDLISREIQGGTGTDPREISTFRRENLTMWPGC